MAFFSLKARWLFLGFSCMSRRAGETEKAINPVNPVHPVQYKVANIFWFRLSGLGYKLFDLLRNGVHHLGCQKTKGATFCGQIIGRGSMQVDTDISG